MKVINYRDRELSFSISVNHSKNVNLAFRQNRSGFELLI